MFILFQAIIVLLLNLVFYNN